MSEKGGTLFLIAIVVVIAGLLLTVMRPMFSSALDSVEEFFNNIINSAATDVTP